MAGGGGASIALQQANTSNAKWGVTTQGKEKTTTIQGKGNWVPSVERVIAMKGEDQRTTMQGKEQM